MSTFLAFSALPFVRYGHLESIVVLMPPTHVSSHACPGRFLAVHEIVIAGALLVSKYSKIEIQNKALTKMMLLDNLGMTPASPIIFTSRGVKPVAL